METKLDATLITPTKRHGGFDILLAALARQKMPRDRWEAIIIDDMPEPEWSARHLMVDEWKDDMRIIHMKSGIEPYYKSNRLIAHARNAALVRARGELCVFVDDYSGFGPYFLEEHWNTYEATPWCALGPVIAVPWTETRPEDLSTLPVVTVDKRSFYNRGGGMVYEKSKWPEGAQDHRSQMFGDTRDCPAGWWYSSNSSAPLERIVEAGGFPFVCDLTSEEDVMLGLMLEKKGVKFWFRTDEDISVWHMQHGNPAIQPEPLYANEDIQKVTPDLFKTKCEGSWAVREWMEREGLESWNAEVGWSLAEEREKWRSSGSR